jgi:hypothetical protein
MIELSACHVADVLQGGIWMVVRPSSSGSQVTPAQVWPALSGDLRTRVIALLAELALYIVVARPPGKKGGEERSHACSAPSDQNPS